MLDRLAELEQRYQELEAEMARPEVYSDPDRLREMAKEYASLEEIVSVFREYRKLQEQLQEAQEILQGSDDSELRTLAEEEIAALKPQVEALNRKLRLLLLPKDPLDEKNVIVEIRAGTGGEEAALFAADLLRMYTRYAERQGWKLDFISSTPSDLGGFKEVIFAVEGKGAYSKLKYESGPHRVQRVPVTESSGRIHTSAATVAVLPEADEIDLEINPNDLEWETFLSSSPGGQHMQKNETAVRVRHKPTGLVVECQDERSQHRNREKALRVLRSRLYEREKRRQQEEIDAVRRSQVRRGDRSEKIRTYNFPQNRVTDHRINLTLYQLEEILDGELNPLLEALMEAEQEERLAALSAGGKLGERKQGFGRP